MNPGSGYALRSRARSRRSRRGGRYALLAACAVAPLLIGGPVLAQSAPPAPSPNHTWAGCTLDQATVDALKARINAGGQFTPTGGPNSKFNVSFVLVFSLNNDNDGQPLGTGSNPPFTGAILCTNNATGDGGRVGIVTTTETTLLPVQSDATSVDIRDAEQTHILQYRVNGGADAGETEKRVCHTTDSFNDCFRIFPAP